MKRTFLMTVAAAALIAGAGLASAQDKQQMPRTGGTAPAPAAQQSAPAEKTAAPMTQGAGAASSETKIDAKPSVAQDKPMDRSRNAQDQKSKAMEKSAQTPDSKAKADGKMSTDTKADTKASTTTKSSTDTKAGSDNKMSTDAKPSSTTTTKSSSDTKATQSSTTGQGSAATSANITTEQRTQITSVIREQKVRPLANVNFSISIGTRVPREVRYYPLPTRVIEVYPQWRGYSYILVGDQIVIIEPTTYEIVFILT